MRVNITGVNPFHYVNHMEQDQYDLAVLNIVLYLLNVSVHVIKRPLVTNISFYKEEPNHWVVEQLTDGDAEISSTSVILFPESLKNIRHTYALGVFRPELFFKARTLRQSYNIFTLPFSQDVWLTVFSIVLSITAVLFYILARETRLPHETPYDIIARIADEEHEKGIDWSAIHASKKEIKTREHWEVDEICLVTLGALCQQGPPRDPSTIAARVVLLALFILTMSLYTAYSASIISLISLLPDTDEIHSGWTQARNHVVYVQDSPYFRYSFKIPSSEIIYSSISDGFLSLLKHDNVFVGDRDVAVNALHQLCLPAEDRCLIGKSHLGMHYHRVFAFRENSSYLHDFNLNLLKLRENGVLMREYKERFNTQSPCNIRDKNTVAGFTSINLMDVEPAVRLLFYGVIAACVILLLEIGAFYSSLEIQSIFLKPWKTVDKKIVAILEKWSRSQLIKEFQRSRRIVKKSNKNNFLH